jgi:hypothetical protein
MDPIFVEGFPKNRDTLVAGQISEYEGRILAHIREAGLTLDGEPMWKPKGVAIPLELLPAVKDAVHKLRDVAAPNRVVAKIPVGRQQIWVGTRMYHDVFLLDIRRFRLEDGEWRPGKGVSVRGDLVEPLIDLVDRLAEAAKNLK